MSTQQQTYPAIWYTSGTPLNLGQRECAMERYLGYHAGRHGTGYKRLATAIPLATGAGVHDGIELLNRWILDWQAHHAGKRLLSMPDEVTAWAATEAASRYEAKARAKGLEMTKTDLDAHAAVEQLILEQRTLIEAQVWIYALARLSVMLPQAILIDTEFEEGPVLDCTCGLGDWVGQVAQHEARGCKGICVQGRADATWEFVDTRVLTYEEIKTKATPNYGWEQQWEHSGQLWLNMEAKSRRLGREISQAFVPVLYKGKRDRTDRDDKTSPKIQQSPLVYGWFDPGAPPMREADWSARYKWYDDYGKGHTLGKAYKRTPIWDPSTPLDGPNANGYIARAGASRVERWVKGWILPVQYQELLQTLGPFPKPHAMMPDALRSLLVEERKWRADVEWLRAAGIYQPSDVVQVREFLGAADGAVATEADYETRTYTAADIIPRSWACTKFAGDRCQFFPICHHEPGWEDIETIGYYEIRPPHHSLEKAAFAAQGVVFPDDDSEEDGE